jgi:putative tricarboxylic transport membrane protein
MAKQNAALWAGVAVILFGAIFLIQALEFDYYGENGPGPGLLPLWLSVLIMIMGVLYIVESLRHKVAFREILPSGQGLKNVLIILGSLVLLLLTINFIGFTMASTLFLYILLVRAYKWYVGLGIALGISLLLFWVFGNLLSIPLPVNLFGW